MKWSESGCNARIHTSYVPPNRSFEIGKKYYPISITVEAREAAPVGDDPDNGSNPDGQNNADMDTENGASKEQQLPPSGAPASDKGNKSGSSSAANHKVSDVEPVEDNPGSASNTSSTIPEYLASAKRDLLGWLAADKPDEERCFSLLREMELVDDDGFFTYDGGEDTTAADGVSLEQREALSNNHGDISALAPKKTTWGLVMGTRQSIRRKH